MIQENLSLQKSSSSRGHVFTSSDVPTRVGASDHLKVVPLSAQFLEKECRSFCRQYNKGQKERLRHLTGWNVYPDRVDFVNCKNRVLLSSPR